jgi:hypothetical protein
MNADAIYISIEALPALAAETHRIRRLRIPG